MLNDDFQHQQFSPGITNDLLQVYYLITHKSITGELTQQNAASLGHLSENYLIIKYGQQYGGAGSNRMFISGDYGNENALSKKHSVYVYIYIYI